MGAPLVATAATTPSPLTDNKGFFLQWAEVADERGVEVLYPNLEFDMEAIIGVEPDLLIASATGADSVVQHYSELKRKAFQRWSSIIPTRAGRRLLLSSAQRWG